MSNRATTTSRLWTCVLSPGPVSRRVNKATICPNCRVLCMARTYCRKTRVQGRPARLAKYKKMSRQSTTTCQTLPSRVPRRLSWRPWCCMRTTLTSKSSRSSKSIVNSYWTLKSLRKVPGTKTTRLTMNRRRRRSSKSSSCARLSASTV